MSFINKLGKVLIGDENRKHSHFNMSHSVNTTASIGDVFGVGCRYCYPDSKTTIEPEVAIQLSPIIAPFFGKMGLELSYHFVEFADILGGDWYKAFLTKTSYRATNSTYVPQNLPRCTLGSLARWCLVGAHLSVYVQQSNGKYKQPEVGSSEANSVWANCFDSGNNMINSGVTRSYFDTIAQPLYVSCLKHFVTEVMPSSWDVEGRYACLPLALNGSSASATDRKSDIFANPSGSGHLNGHIDITPETADYVHFIEKGTGLDKKPLMFCWKFSAAGQRFAKLLESCGYKIDMDSTRLVSLMPLFSHYFAYWSRFGVQRYINYQNTNMAKLVKHMVENNYLTLDKNSLIDPDLWRAFLQDCTQMWYTDEVDFVSAHQSGTDESTMKAGIDGLYATPSWSGGGTSQPTYTSPIEEANGVASILGASTDDVLRTDVHGAITALDIEYLKRLYVWSQRNSVIGKRVDALLRSQGFGSWCDCQQSNFIGTDYIPISVSKQMINSDTYNPATGTGSFAGDYTGKAVGYAGSVGKKTFKNKSMGYLITLASIKVDSGMTQGLDGTLCATDVIHLPNEEFDGMGYECTPVDQIVGSKACDDFVNYGGTPAQQSKVPFGLVPIYSQFKIARNIASGGFSLRSQRNTFAPWHLDRIIPMSDRLAVYDESSKCWDYTNVIVDASSLPKAGEVWRHIYRYMWLANYTRIFRNYGGTTWNDYAQANGATIFDWVRDGEDNFIIQMYVKEDYWANLKPINESFGTYDDEHKPNGSISKA